MKYLSVCSGIEAATVAWHHMGWEPVGFSEIEKFPSQVLAHHYPNVPNLGDMTKYKEWNIERPNLLVGGTPCQSFSVAGLRKGLEDPRGNLALVYCGILDHYRPKWFIWENVPGVLSSGKGRDFGSFLGAVAELGYGFAYRVLDAQYWGVAQRRKRVFVVGCLGDWRSAAEVLFEPKSLSRDTAPSREKRKETPANAGSSTDRGRWWDGGELAATITTSSDDQRMPDKANAQLIMQPVAIGTDCYNGSITGNVACTMGTPGSSVNASGPTVMQPVAVPEVMATLLSSTAGVSRPGNAVTEHLTYIPMAQPIACIGGLHPNAAIGNDNCPTLTSAMGMGGGHIPAVAQTMAVRRLTPVECERLQGFPDNYTNIKTDCPDGPRYKALGNSMAVPVMKWIGERINNK
jgi:DNA (cytosine-5)-methyltransferase 1